MHLVYPPNFVEPLFFISLGMIVIHRRNWKQWLCKIWWGGGGGKQDACILVCVEMVNALNELCI